MFLLVRFWPPQCLILSTPMRWCSVYGFDDWKPRIIFTNENKILSIETRYVFQCWNTENTEVIAMVEFSAGPTAGVDWRNRFCREEVRLRQKTHDSWFLVLGSRPARARTFYAVEEIVLSQEDVPAPEMHRTVRHFGHENDSNVLNAWERRKKCRFSTDIVVYLGNGRGPWFEVVVGRNSVDLL